MARTAAGVGPSPEIGGGCGGGVAAVPGRSAVGGPDPRAASRRRCARRGWCSARWPPVWPRSPSHARPATPAQPRSLSRPSTGSAQPSLGREGRSATTGRKRAGRLLPVVFKTRELATTPGGGHLTASAPPASSRHRPRKPRSADHNRGRAVSEAAQWIIPEPFCPSTPRAAGRLRCAPGKAGQDFATAKRSEASPCAEEQ